MDNLNLFPNSHVPKFKIPTIPMQFTALLDWTTLAVRLQLVIPKVRYSEGPSFRRSVIPKVRYSEGSWIRNWNKVC